MLMNAKQGICTKEAVFKQIHRGWWPCYKCLITNPMGNSLDVYGNILFVDYGNKRIREVVYTDSPLAGSAIKDNVNINMYPILIKNIIGRAMIN